MYRCSIAKRKKNQLIDWEATGVVAGMVAGRAGAEQVSLSTF